MANLKNDKKFRLTSHFKNAYVRRQTYKSTYYVKLTTSILSSWSYLIFGGKKSFLWTTSKMSSTGIFSYETLVHAIAGVCVSDFCWIWKFLCPSHIFFVKRVLKEDKLSSWTWHSNIALAAIDNYTLYSRKTSGIENLTFIWKNLDFNIVQCHSFINCICKLREISYNNIQRVYLELKLP